MQIQIPGLVETLVGTNISPRSQGYELGGVIEYSDRATLDAYGGHPVHQKLLTLMIASDRILSRLTRGLTVSEEDPGVRRFASRSYQPPYTS